MTELHYRLVESWTGEEWPNNFHLSLVADMNAVTPPGFFYSFRPGKDGTEDRIELFERSSSEMGAGE